MVDISIVIPVYNVEKYFDRCLQSIKSQTFKNYEVIIVDDGSTDSSLQISRNYSNIDNRFKLFHQDNLGPSIARNTALKRTRGKYLCFMDADDCYSTDDALQILFDRMEESQADVCVFSWNQYEINGRFRKYKFSKEEIASESESLINILMKGNYKGGGGNPWNKIWRIDSLRNDGRIHDFNPSLQIYEDMLWVIQSLEKVKKIIFLNQALYNYYILEGSLSRNGDPVKRTKKFADGAKCVYEYICNNCRFAEDNALIWYRDKYSSFLINKVKCKVKLTATERQMIQTFSLRFQDNMDYRMWRRVCCLKIISFFI